MSVDEKDLVCQRAYIQIFESFFRRQKNVLQIFRNFVATPKIRKPDLGIVFFFGKRLYRKVPTICRLCCHFLKILRCCDNLQAISTASLPLSSPSSNSTGSLLVSSSSSSSSILSASSQSTTRLSLLPAQSSLSSPASLSSPLASLVPKLIKSSMKSIKSTKSVILKAV